LQGDSYFSVVPEPENSLCGPENNNWGTKYAKVKITLKNKSCWTTQGFGMGERKVLLKVKTHSLLGAMKKSHAKFPSNDL